MYRTYTMPIPEAEMKKAGLQTISFHAGTKSSQLIRRLENHDDFELKNVRMILSNGTQIPQSMQSRKRMENGRQQ
ncbi:hypothetical protein ACEQPO_25950 [Bacillus sp. SL00103]